MNDQELLAAHGELEHDIASFEIRALGRRDPGRWVLDVQERDGMHAPGDVPGWLLPRLTKYAENLGYPVSYERVIAGEPGILGQTRARKEGGELVTSIALKKGASPASRARTLCHELAHAQAYYKCIANELLAELRGEDPGVLRSDEEVIAETCAALSTRALGVGWGDFSLAYLIGNGDPDQFRSTREEAIRRASTLLKAIA